MGQQQLLLVILVTIIVGIATVVAINTFGSAADSANIDAVRQDIATFAASAQGYFMKPEMLGGGGGTWDGLTFNKVAFPADETADGGETALNSNGVYLLNITAGDSVFTIAGHPSSRITSVISPTARVASGEDELVAEVGPGGINWNCASCKNE
ncbi:MAG: hypothetical protein WD053_12025 [Gracilimonas sp.]